MAWLVHDGKVLASCVAVDRRPIAIIPVGELIGAQIITGQRWFCTGRVGADVAFCDHNNVVIAVNLLPGWRIVRSPARAASMVVGESGAFERWRLAIGDELGITQ